MVQWETIAEGVSLTELSQLVEDMDLPKGTKIKAIIETSTPWAFDIASAELVFKPFVPSDVKVIDVYGEGGITGGQGIIDMEVDPPIGILAFLAFIKAHWLAIMIAGIALTLLISFIVVMIKLPAKAAIPVALLVGVAIGIVAIVALSAREPVKIPMKGG